jgi:hypothetical protein
MFCFVAVMAAYLHGCGRDEKKASNKRKRRTLGAQQIESILHQLDVNDVDRHFELTDMPYKVCSGVSSDEWEACLEAIDDENIPVSARYLEVIGDELFVIGMASPPHEHVQGAFHDIFVAASGNRRGFARHHHIKVRVPRKRCLVVGDQTYGPRGMQRVTFALEVARTETLDHVVRKAKEKWAFVPGLRYILCLVVPENLEQFTYRFYHVEGPPAHELVAMAKGDDMRVDQENYLRDAPVNITINTRELLERGSGDRLPLNMPEHIIVNLREVIHEAWFEQQASDADEA